ncbi:MAG: hypothetical protein IJ711_07380 [Lachnospiraceae bacterium]|nr:hypothetical protein [Lachnospiraceae bacterium]
MASGRKDIPLGRLEKLITDGGKKFVSYKEGAELLSLGLHTFQDLAKDAKAVYKIRGRALVNIQLVYDYMEAFREEF